MYIEASNVITDTSQRLKALTCKFNFKFNGDLLTDNLEEDLAPKYSNATIIEQKDSIAFIKCKSPILTDDYFEADT